MSDKDELTERGMNRTARETQYADAMGDQWEHLADARAAIAVADREQAQLRAGFEMELALLRARVKAAAMVLAGLEEAVEEECEVPDDGTCHGFEVTAKGDCSIRSGLEAVGIALREAVRAPEAAPSGEGSES